MSAESETFIVRIVVRSLVYKNEEINKVVILFDNHFYSSKCFEKLSAGNLCV